MPSSQTETVPVASPGVGEDNPIGCPHRVLGAESGLRRGISGPFGELGRVSDETLQLPLVTSHDEAQDVANLVEVGTP